MSKISKQVGSNIGMNITALIKKYEARCHLENSTYEPLLNEIISDLKELAKINASWGKLTVKSSNVDCGGNR
jgi:hypothetical protein